MKFPELTKPQRWGLINGTFALFVILGPGFGITGTTNIAVFFAWLTFIVTSVLLNKDARETYLEDKEFELPIPIWADLTFDAFITGIFLWNGFWFTTIAYIIHIIILTGFREEHKKYWKQKEQE